MPPRRENFSWIISFVRALLEAGCKREWEERLIESGVSFGEELSKVKVAFSGVSALPFTKANMFLEAGFSFEVRAERASFVISSFVK